MIPTKVLTVRGYSIAKAGLNPKQIDTIKTELKVAPIVPKTYAGTAQSFTLWSESKERFYLPVAWANDRFGICPVDTRPEGDALPESLQFQGTLRQHQEEAISAFKTSKNGIICLPCGYGKTFTGIAIAKEIGKCFLIVVHKEFLADQWSEELMRLLPGVRIGRIQGERCDIGSEYDVAIAMIQTICSRSFKAGTFQRFGFAIFDEVHHLGAEHFSQTLQQIHCKRMLGLTATPARQDGLSKVFEWYLGQICYQIARRPQDDTVRVEIMRYVCDVPAYAVVGTNWKGDVIRARMINQIANYVPRTKEIIGWLHPHLLDTDRKLLILSDRREHLTDFEKGFQTLGLSSIGYYVGGMKQKDLDISAAKQIILGTFAMASEGMNIPTLNAVLLATPKSNIEQSVGRILRLKPEERTIQPIIFDIVDSAFVECYGQWSRRKKFYKECGYSLRWRGSEQPEEQDADAEPAKKGVCMIED
jgi:superfamily II DNA or RNA helicase